MKGVIRHSRRSGAWLGPLAVAALLLAVMGVLRAQAQQLDGPAWPGGESPQFFDILVGWDFTGMTAQEESAFMAMAAPLTEEEAIQQLTPALRKAREETIRMENDPVAYAQWLVDHPLTPEQSAQRDFSVWTITHPVEYGRMVLEKMTPAQLQQLQASAWAISHPKEAFAVSQQSQTPEQAAAIAQASKEFMNPVPRPKPVTVQVPFSDAASILNPPIPQN